MMKIKLVNIGVTAALLLSCCTGTIEKSAHNSIKSPINDEETTEEIKLHKLIKLFVVGDFEGDGKLDTLFQHNYSKRTRTEIEFSADPIQHEWETVIKWFYAKEADVHLTLNNRNQDTLRLGTAQGLYCLINVGDINNDGREEIALVVDYLDFSSLNSCEIYTFCSSKWTLLKEFSIHEDAFTLSSGKASRLDNIKGYLEKRHGKWVHKDYHEAMLNGNDFAKMLPLNLERCD